MQMLSRHASNEVGGPQVQVLSPGNTIGSLARRETDATTVTSREQSAGTPKI